MGKPKIHIAEEELVARLKARDKEAFEYFYDNYSPAFFSILLKILGSQELAEDTLQEAFVKIWTNMASYDEKKGRLFTWALNVSRNTALDKLKSKHLKYQIQNLEKSVHIVDSQMSSSQKTDHIGLRETVDNLRIEHRELIELAYYGGYTQEEIAKELKLPLGTVKTKMRNAIVELRKVFKPDGH
ncbi:MAG: RNA polymerase sigma factor [Bacteroidia bacterium]